MTRLACVASALLVACASVDDPEPELDLPAQTRILNMGMVTTALANEQTASVPSQSGGIGWELTVDPAGVIRGGETFTAELSAKAIFDERLLNLGQRIFPGGIRTVSILNFQATVTVRKGAVGLPVVLTPDPEQLPCDPQSEPCVRTVPVPISTECEAGGVCDRLGHTGIDSQCQNNHFCVTGPLAIPLVPLPEEVPAYTADGAGTVRFGFDDSEVTGFEIRREGDCNDGTYYRDPLAFEDPVGPNGARAWFGPIPVAFEWIMAEDSRLDYGIDSCDATTSPTPDANLIKFEIQPP